MLTTAHSCKELHAWRLRYRPNCTCLHGIAHICIPFWTKFGPKDRPALSPRGLVIPARNSCSLDAVPCRPPPGIVGIHPLGQAVDADWRIQPVLVGREKPGEEFRRRVIEYTLIVRACQEAPELRVAGGAYVEPAAYPAGHAGGTRTAQYDCPETRHATGHHQYAGKKHQPRSL